jgi:phosphoglycerol transferase
MTQPKADVEHGDNGATKGDSAHARHGLDIIAILLLIAVIASSWCYGQGVWNRTDWQTPLTYKGPYAVRDRSDILVYSGFIRAARDGHFAPFTAKFIPELGAPYDGNWNDWPYLEYVPLYLIGVLARGVGIFAALNIALLACNCLAGLAFYLVARYRKIDITWSFTAALAFGLTPFIFMHSPDHPMVAFCWHVPLLVLVLRWLTDEDGIALGSKRFWAGMSVAFIAGLLNPYYFSTFAQLVFLTAGAMFLRTRNKKHLWIAACLVGSTVVAFILINLNPWLNQIRVGPSQGAIVRQFQWLEIYALKALDLLIPPSNHQWAAFREIAQWRAGVALLHDEGSYLGIIGVAALVMLIAAAIRGAVHRGSGKIPAEALWVLWIFLYFSTGGLNAIVGTLGFTYLRAGCRLSVFILAIALLFSAEWLSRRQLQPAKGIALAVVCCLIILLDQVPIPPSPEEKAEIAQQVASDQKFVGDLENILPPGAMVFQLPVMDFPEAPLRTESSYDQLRPYLFTRQLRWSFGSMKGRPREQWQHDVEKLSLPESIAAIKNRGFSALYVSRVGYPDGARELEENLRTLGYTREIENSDRDLFCILLQ